MNSEALNINQQFTTAAAHQPARGTVLLADQDAGARGQLSRLLEEMGYRVVQAADGPETLEVFQQQAPDFVCIDVGLPRINGYQAATRIKQLCADRYVPVLLLTATAEEEDPVACIEAGADDFVDMPVSNALFKARILSMERLREVHGSVRGMYQMLCREEEIASQVFSNAVMTGNVALARIHAAIRPASTFNGDMLLTAYTPSGDLNVLLGDFTGHGLASALGALPASEVFRAMSAKGFSGEQIISGINGKLHALLPTGMFLAVQMIQVSFDLRKLTVFNYGMPDILLIDGASCGVKNRFRSNGLPLAILEDFCPGREQVVRQAISPGDSVILSSDGLYDAANTRGELFGVQRTLDAITAAQPGPDKVDAIMHALDAFCGDVAQADDVSLAEIPLTADLQPQGDHRPAPQTAARSVNNGHESLSGWELSLVLEGRRLRHSNPVPLLISQVQEIENLGPEREALFTVLSELFVNALDHGVLGLDSTLKATPNGFSRYLEERDRRLSELDEGRIAIHLETQCYANGGRMVIRVSDSGGGFDFTDYALDVEPGQMPSGRGILLVRSLCDSVCFQEPGNQVEAVYSWSSR